jgi:hypothetical protein
VDGAAWHEHGGSRNDFAHGTCGTATPRRPIEVKRFDLVRHMLGVLQGGHAQGDAGADFG